MLDEVFCCYEFIRCILNAVILLRGHDDDGGEKRFLRLAKIEPSPLPPPPAHTPTQEMSAAQDK